MLNLAANKTKYRKLKSYYHGRDINNQTDSKSVSNDFVLVNTTNQTAPKAVLLLYLKIKPGINSTFKITECSHKHRYNIYPNGMVQVNFETDPIKPGEKIKLKYKISSENEISNRDNLIRYTNFFLCF